jgi:hypothetical protein
MDPASPWNVGALQSMALETMTLSSRLRSSEAGRSTLQELEEAINPTGKRRIAKLEMSVADPEVISGNSSSQIVHAEKVSSTLSTQNSDGLDDTLTEFDIDLFTKDYHIGAANPSKREHIFGRVEANRGEWSLPTTEGIDPHNRFNLGPVVQRYVILFIYGRVAHFAVFGGKGGGARWADLIT